MAPKVVEFLQIGGLKLMLHAKHLGIDVDGASQSLEFYPGASARASYSPQVQCEQVFSHPTKGRGVWLIRKWAQPSEGSG